MPNLLKSVGKAIKKTAAFNVSSEAPAQVKSLLQKYGNEKIVKIQVARKPIINAIKKIVDLVSDVEFDKLFHLFIIVVLENGITLRLERNQRVNFTQSIGLNDETEIMDVPLNKNITFGEFIEKGNKIQGDLYWRYSGINNNCQSFVYNTLYANGLMNGDLKSFIKQDIQNLVKPFLSEVADTITDLAHSVDVLKGNGSNGIIGFDGCFIKI